ncbi:MAG: hypothetical protein AABX34_03055, partial [Nanoarchaeota archaeon]
MNNPLSIEERLSVTRLIDHDLLSVQRRLAQFKGTHSHIGLTSYHPLHVRDVMLSIVYLSSPRSQKCS